ncbi:S-adenosylmethionine:tRNA ribosyltransferase-isomerase [Helicobacter saguini]|uniref:S-adenosylmethionine:tRNA ribosyltransferase-isomerase n=1 Tax=Helicobacter saguini TaxID=1548018 RepID=A0A347VS94_9HELI|nr:S-adenosylmethionine:tRNA ribosyltransferase-isomerase [Helicobacter saguini]MWV62601.1 S-adenosylmethionine:tRNA ribosyltransferase-isomerase [Helicobacter saguini]MWV66727.1 S-adenosylmethionine:tRNA ribosyltransferase-isomerase [Helicobacter saguini]MWV69077.1 S-adenosylmethionine:tRNA ribosyltransferase-isomerase [Helicobacter saguini]MWV71369.1 S-adenosylmethionine:tRNA ribosyltransferase-isomerase [Helicobacter saguini]TLD94003.1 S-adenosylmethionine:tRNA ribosyltransferase-isomerase 
MQDSINIDSKDCLLESYDFILPSHLIAFEPCNPKENAKLLVYKNGEIIHTTFKHFFDFVPRDYLIVLNDTRVIKARIFGEKILNLDSIKSYENTNFENFKVTCDLESNATFHKKSREIFYHKALDSNNHLVQIKGRVKENDIFKLDSNIFMCVVKLRNDGFREVVFFKIIESSKLYSIKNSKNNNFIESSTINSKIPNFLESKFGENIQILNQSEIFSLLENKGKIPLPPYIKRESTKRDCKDYQSLFAKVNGSVAAPTASLHFSREMLGFLESNFNVAYVTLHVGAGTFKPVETADITTHKMHEEYCEISLKNAKKILNTQKILCVGSTAMRSVEWLNDNILKSSKNTNLENFKVSPDSKDFIESKLIGQNSIFLHPQNKPKKVNALLTNFHLPKSSLIMLVSSLIGRENTLKLYHEAILHNYKFYSYGDCMLII